LFFLFFCSYAQNTSDTLFVPNQAADQLFKQVRKAIRELNTFSFKSEYRFGEINKEPIVAFYTMRMKKPGYFRLDLYTPDSILSGVLLHDGNYVWEYWPGKRPKLSIDDSLTYEKTKYHSYFQYNVPAKKYYIKKEFRHLSNDVIWMCLELNIFF
jgi:outer membrane lipoprotein-sorting protein